MCNVSTSKAKSKRGKGRIWRSDALMGLLVVLAVFALHASTDLFGGLERRFYDLASTQTSRLPSDRIAVIAIDDQSIANIGRWPWPREVHAQLIDQLGAAGAKTVAHTAFFFEPQTDRGLVQLRELRGLLDGWLPAALRAPLMRYTPLEPLVTATVHAVAETWAAGRYADSVCRLRKAGADWLPKPLASALNMAPSTLKSWSAEALSLAMPPLKLATTLGRQLTSLALPRTAVSAGTRKTASKKAPAKKRAPAKKPAARPQKTTKSARQPRSTQMPSRRRPQE